MKKTYQALTVGAVIILALIVYGYWPRAVQLQGEVVIRQLNISPRVSGRVEQILAREGDFVRKGEVVATLYAPDIVAKSVQADAPRDLAYKNYQRIKELFEDGVVSAQTLDEAQARAEQMQGVSDASQTFVNELELVAPTDGEISTVVLESGELASPGVAVLTLLDTQDVWVTFNVREDLLASFALGQTLQVRIPALGKQTHPFTISYISKQGDWSVWSATKTRGEFDLKTFEVRARPVSQMPQLRQGMSALTKLKP